MLVDLGCDSGLEQRKTGDHLWSATPRGRHVEERRAADGVEGVGADRSFGAVVCLSLTEDRLDGYVAGLSEKLVLLHLLDKSLSLNGYMARRQAIVAKSWRSNQRHRFDARFDRGGARFEQGRILISASYVSVYFLQGCESHPHRRSQPPILF